MHILCCTPKSRMGMTLLEVLIALGLIAGITMVIVASIGDTSGNNLRRTSSQLVRMIKHAYVQAALTNSYYRISFNLTEEPQTFVLEESKTPFYIIRENDEAEQIRLKNEERLGDDDEEGSVSQTVGKGDFAETEDELTELTEVPDNIKIVDIQTEADEEAQTEGEIALYFFPRGYTQFAVLHLSDIEETDFMTLSISPLSGEVTVVAEFVEYDEAREEE